MSLWLLKLLSRKPKTTVHDSRERIDSCYSAVFNSAAGRVVLDDLLKHSVCRLRNSDLTDQELRGWVQGLTVEQREKFVDSAFQVLEASGAQTLTDLKADSFKAVRPMVRALKDLDKETREALLKFMSILFMSNLRMTLEGIQEETEKSLLRNGKKAERSAGKKG